MSERTSYRLIVAVCLFVSLGGICIASRTFPEQGGDGGAIGVAISVFVLFVRNDWGARAQAVLKHSIDAESAKPEDLKGRIEAIEGRLRLDSGAQRGQNLALGISSAISTLACGFGADLAGYLARAF